MNKNKFNIQTDSFISNDDYIKYANSFAYNPASTVSIKRWSPNKITIESNVVGLEDEKHFILLSEIYFPYGWRVEGENNIKIVEVNNLVRGFFVSSGRNEIILSFDPQIALVAFMNIIGSFGASIPVSAA